MLAWVIYVHANTPYLENRVVIQSFLSIHYDACGAIGTQEGIRSKSMAK